MVEHKHVLLPIPIKKKLHGVMSGDLGGQECSAMSLGSVLQSIDAIFSITNGSVCLGASSGI